MTDFGQLLKRLAAANVDFIVIGGVAATLHGSARLTLDLDVVYERGIENLNRVVAALESQSPYLRGAPAGLPFRWDTETLKRGLNFTLTTSEGAVDLLGEIPGGTYESLLPESTLIDAFGIQCRVLDLAALIRVKRAAGRPKDFEAIAELEALADRERS
jgi:hypothetical protein